MKVQVALVVIIAASVAGLNKSNTQRCSKGKMSGRFKSMIYDKGNYGRVCASAKTQKEEKKRWVRGHGAAMRSESARGNKTRNKGKSAMAYPPHFLKRAMKNPKGFIHNRTIVVTLSRKGGNHTKLGGYKTSNDLLAVQACHDKPHQGFFDTAMNTSIL